MFNNNLLSNAFTSIKSIWPLQRIIIENREVKMVKGVRRTADPEVIECMSIIQPENPTDLTLDNGKVQSVDLYSVWIIGDNLSLIYSKLVKSRESHILWNNKRFKVYSKSDYSLNGWIEVKMTDILDETNSGEKPNSRYFNFHKSNFDKNQFDH